MAQRGTSEAVALFRSEYFAPPEGAAEAPQPMADTAKADATSGAEMSFAESLWLKLGGGFDTQTTWLFWISISIHCRALVRKLEVLLSNVNFVDVL